MTNISGWITFKEIIDSLMLAEGDQADPGQFMRKLNFAIKEYEDLRLHQIPATKPVTLAIQGEMRVVLLPDDFLKFVSIGVYQEDEWYEFQPKSAMPVVSTADCGVDTRDTADETYITQMVCYYKIELDNRRIVIEAPLNITEVILNYTPTGVRKDGLTWIPRMCQRVIEAGIEYQEALRDKKMYAFDKQAFQLEYLRQLMKFRGLQYNTDELFNEYYEQIAISKQY